MGDEVLQQQQQPTVDADDLSLIDPALEDEGKDPAEIWNELEKAESAAASSDPDDTAPAGEQPAGAGEGGEDAAAAAAGEQGSGQAAESAGGKPAGEPSDGGKPSDKNKQPPDIWATATPEQRAAFEAAQAQLKKLEQAERSNRGRLSALQRQINELTLSGKKPDAASSAAKGAKQDEDQGDGFLASAEWKAFQEEYPEVAGPMAKVIGALQAELTTAKKELSAIGSERRQSALEEQAQLLSEAHPDWTDVTADKGFVDWLNSQPRHIREAAARNANEIVDAEEAADVVGRYKAFRAEQNGGGNAQQSAARQGAGGNPNTRTLTGKRQLQLESATAARSRGPGVAAGIPEDGDPETLWKQFDEIERRQARA